MRDEPSPSPESPASDPILIPLGILLFTAGFFALWTVASSVVTFGGLQRGALYPALAIASFGAVAALGLTRRLKVELLFCDLTIPSLRRSFQPASKSSKRSVVIALFSSGALLAGLAAFVWWQSFWPFWIAGVATALMCALAVGGNALKQAPLKRPQAGVATYLRDLMMLALLCAAILAIYFFTMKPDGDDAFYLNLPVGINSLVSGGVLASDTMMGAGDWPLLMPTYRAESLPTLTAVLASVLGIPSRYVAHAVLPAIWCINLAAALFVIGRLVFDRHWLVFGLLSVTLLLALDGSLQGYAAHGLTRFFHGKGPLIAIVVPLIAFLTWVAGRRWAPTTLLTIAALQVCAVGLTANGIYVAPLALGVVALSVFLSAPPSDRLWSFTPLLATAYPLCIGLYLLVVTPPFGVEEWNTPSIVNDFWMMFPRTYLLGFVLSLLIAVMLLGPISRRWRFPPIYAGCLLLFVFNPLLWNSYADLVTGNLNYRLFWAVPIPAIGAGVLTIAWISTHSLGRGVIATMAAVALIAPTSILRPSSGISYGLSLVKIDTRILEAVEKTNAMTPAGKRVLAPRELALWLPTIENHRYPVVVRDDYLDIFLSRVGSERIAERRSLFQWVNGEQPAAPLTSVKESLEKLCVGTIVLKRSASSYRSLRTQVIGLGATTATTVGDFEIFSLLLDREACV